jgi:hypothetical protein
VEHQGGRFGRRAVLASGALAALGSAVGCGRLNGGPDYPRGPLPIASGVVDGVYNPYGTELAGRITAMLSGVKPRVDVTGGSVDNLAMVIDGGSTFGFAASDVLARTLAAATGHDLAGLAHIYDDYVHLVVTERSGISSIHELRGKRVSQDRPGSGVELVARRVLAAAGLDPYRDVHPVHSHLTASIAMLRVGTIDAFFWSGGLPTAAIARLSRTVPIRLLPLGWLGDRMVRAHGPYYRTSTVPNMMYPGVGDVPSLAMPNYVVTRGAVDDGLAFHLTKILISQRDVIAAKVPSANQLDVHSAIQTGGLDLHSGAVRYYRSIKP